MLQAWRRGDPEALGRIIPLMQRELRLLAHRYMARERAGHTLQTSALVNEAYLRLLDADQVDWKDRAHFLAIAANLMRRILVDHARSRSNRKRGGDRKEASLEVDFLAAPTADPDLVKLDDALTALAAFDGRKARVVELRYFGGLDLDETAEVLKVSRDTVKRDWRLARTWIYCEMTGSRDHDQ